MTDIVKKRVNIVEDDNSTNYKNSQYFVGKIKDNDKDDVNSGLKELDNDYLINEKKMTYLSYY